MDAYRPHIIDISLAGNQTTGTKKFSFVAPVNGRIYGVQGAVGTAPTGASILVDINKNGTTVFTTQANRPTIAAAATVAVTGAIQVPKFSKGDVITVDIDQIGSGTAGADLALSVVLVLDY